MHLNHLKVVYIHLFLAVMSKSLTLDINSVSLLATSSKTPKSAGALSWSSVLPPNKRDNYKLSQFRESPSFVFCKEKVDVPSSLANSAFVISALNFPNSLS